MLLRLDDASVRFGTLGERLGAVACSSEKKDTCIQGGGTLALTIRQQIPCSLELHKCTEHRTFQDLARVEKKMSLTGTSGTFKLSVHSNVKVITSDQPINPGDSFWSHVRFRPTEICDRALKSMSSSTMLPGNQLLSNTSARRHSRIR